MPTPDNAQIAKVVANTIAAVYADDDTEWSATQVLEPNGNITVVVRPPTYVTIDIDANHAENLRLENIKREARALVPVLVAALREEADRLENL